MENLKKIENENANIDEILANSQNGVIEALKIINNQNKKRDEKIEIIEKEQEKAQTEIATLKKNTNVLCSPFHSKRRRNLGKLCKARVWHLLNDDKTSCEYVLFSGFLFKKIYSDIAISFDLDTWLDLDMENYDHETSMYSRAKELASNWIPSARYVKYCTDNLIEKRDNGVLSQEKCRALTQYLKATNNGKLNPFSA